HPLAVQNVHLTEHAIMSEEVCEKLVFVREAPATVKHGFLMEGRESHTLNPIFLGNINRRRQGFADTFADRRVRFSNLEFVRIKIVQINYRNGLGGEISL